MSKPVILISTPYYAPGFKGGGPVVSVSRLVERLSDQFDFKILTPNHDWKDHIPYTDVPANQWIKRGTADVFYLSADQIKRPILAKILSKTTYDLIYFNSFFHPAFTFQPLLLRKLKQIPRKPVCLAPRGEFSPGALALKAAKKTVFIKAAKLAGIYSGIHWQATSSEEIEHIQQHFGKKAKVHHAGNLLPALYNAKEKKPEKRRGHLRIIFLSRIARKKNLRFVLEILKHISSNIVFDIYGPLEDKVYWDECQKIIQLLPQNIKVGYGGDVPQPDVQSIFSQYDLFFFPTLGENFGHVILEALSAGCPVLLSDQTPWKDLEKVNAGWSFPLESQEKFNLVLQHCTEMDASECNEYTDGARNYLQNLLANNPAEQQTRDMFEKILAEG